MQIPWADVAARLTAALRGSQMPLQALAKAAGVQYHAVYRMHRHGVTYRGQNAIKLCKFFKIAIEVTPQVSKARLTAAVLDSWDGTAEHGRLLIDLARCAKQYRVISEADGQVHDEGTADG